MFSGDVGEDVFNLSLDGKTATEPEAKFINKIINMVSDKDEIINQKIAAQLTDWTLDRIIKSDWAVLRVAVAEIMIGEVPPAVIINECVNISKKYGEPTSAAFVNGVLAKIVG